MTRQIPAMLLVALTAVSSAVVSGCGSNALTTGSLFGGGGKTAAAPAAPRNDPTARAFQVGAVSARAQKCGFNFDAGRLKSTFMAAEAQGGTSADELAKVDRLYNVTQSTVAKAIATAEEYCSDERLAYIRGDLTRHLAGDFAPGAARSFAKDEGGLVSFGGNTPIDDNRATAQAAR
ncbi:MAG: hypothetical protein ABL908_14740 [Hyphomicrobium sp.]